MSDTMKPKSLPCWLSQLNWDSQQGRDRATSWCNRFFLIWPILFLYYEESLVSSNLNTKLCTYFGFIVSDLIYIHSTYSGLHIRQLIISYTATLFIIFFSQDQLVIMQIFEINWETKWCRLQMPILKRG